ncbi:MAG: GNAT family N-acetyltransferase [Planctomycetes bacterium]|nr:GNAT family N-acetyltransferase [Planctomycetota bacterium]
MKSELDLRPGETEFDHVTVRSLDRADIGDLVKIDAEILGRSRTKYFEVKVDLCLKDTGLNISLVAETDGMVAGFLLGRVYYGEFGLPEPTAIIDTIAVRPSMKGRKVGGALIRQLSMNMHSLGIEKIQTNVEWRSFDLLGFLGSQGFEPTPTLCLEKKL